MYYILFYDYVADVAERRGPHRAAHLSLLNALHADGKLAMAGAYTDPLDGAALVFTAREAAEAFVQEDPYIVNGLVNAHRIREWNVVVG
ncbi:MAG TPA: YciI family protein [Tepidiformaceae bacterium]|nr:YciI family protein [Tepidiformaceae bacterium]